jgi:predicted enzyme related to lactoylglutathione lyase
MVTRTMYVIAVPDLERSCAFYRDVLGFTVETMGDSNSGWRMLVHGACRIMAGECPDALPPADLGDHSYFAYLVVDDVDAWWTRVAGRAAIGKPITDEPWNMREFGLRTVDGHRIMVGQPRT